MTKIIRSNPSRKIIGLGLIWFSKYLMYSVKEMEDFTLLQPTGYLMHQQFNIQQLYAPSTLYLCVLYLSENKQRLVPLTA